MRIKFGLFSDLHYSLPDAEKRGNSGRTFEDSLKGMQRFVDEHAAFVVALGDNMQPAKDSAEAYQQFQTMYHAWCSYGIPVHLANGNHEFFQLSLKDVLEIQQTDRTYYSFDIDEYRFLILDSCYNPDDTHFSEDNFDWRFGKLSETEVVWLKEKLADKKKTVLFTHYNIYFNVPDEENDWYQVMNKEQVQDILEESGCIVAVFQGHNHTFQHFIHNGLHYINIPSPERSDSFSLDDFPIIELTDQSILLNGKIIV